MIKHNCIADILIVCSLLWIVLFCSQGCKKESTTQPNTNTTIGAPVSLQDRTLDLDGDNKVDFIFTYSAVTSNTYPSSATFFSLYTLGLDSNQVQTLPQAAQSHCKTALKFLIRVVGPTLRDPSQAQRHLHIGTEPGSQLINAI